MPDVRYQPGFSFEILQPESPQEAPQQKGGNLGYKETILDLGLLLAIPGRHRHINDSTAGNIQLHQKVITIAITGVDLVQVNPLESFSSDGSITILRVSNFPVS